MEKFCKNCGCKLEENAKFCASCGGQVNTSSTSKVENSVNQISTQDIPTYQYTNSIPESTGDIEIREGRNARGMAIAAFVISIIGLINPSLLYGVIAISFGVTAKNKMKYAKNEDVKAKGFSTAAIIIGVISMLLAVLKIIPNL